MVWTIKGSIRIMGPLLCDFGQVQAAIVLPNGCGSQKLIAHGIVPPTVHNDDVSRRLLEMARLSHTLAAVPVAIQGHPFPATGGGASDDNS